MLLELNMYKELTMLRKYILDSTNEERYLKRRNAPSRFSERIPTKPDSIPVP